MSIAKSIKVIQNIMRRDAGIDGDAQRISQLAWLLFLKIFDDQELELELIREGYRSPIPEPLRWRNWAADDEGITGEALLDFVNNDLFPTLKALKATAASDPRGFVVKQAFEDAYNYMKSGQLLRQVINKIQSGIDFNNQMSRHLFNDIYEKILRDLQSAGNAGEFYTPRALTQVMTELAAPQLGETILDPACGTGGFLVCALEYFRKQVKTVENARVLERSLHGVEKKQLPHLLCVTNMLLHEVEIPSFVIHDNMLSRPLRDYKESDRVNIILTNPPFGGNEEQGIENNFPADVRTKETADLFLVLIVHLLKDSGRGAIILPDAYSEGVKARVRERLLTECNLHTVVRLPNGVFSPYTNIRTNLLFFTKGTPTTHVWFYEHQYPAGYKNYSKTKPLRYEEFKGLKSWWGSEADGFTSRRETDVAWRVDIAQIRDRNFDLDFKNPNKPQTVALQPAELVRDVRLLEEQLAKTKEQLFSALIEAMNA